MASVNQGLVEMFRYNAWANHQLFESCRSLTEEKLDYMGAGVSGSVRELLMHIAGGQQTDILRSLGRQHEGELARWSEWPGIEEVIAVAERTSEELIERAGKLDVDEDVQLQYQGKIFRYPKLFFFIAAIEHSAEHRTEVKVALNQIDVSTPDLDGWFYAEAAGYGDELGLIAGVTRKQKTR
jgi:uncharacterized damage-inducible protein DinB